MAARRRGGRALRRGLLRAKDGASAVEFAIVALPFFFIIFAILEVGLIFTVDSVLENAVIETGRLVRTGQASARSMTALQFRNELCSRMTVFSADCPNRVSIDVRRIPRFDTPPPDPISGGTFQSATLSYTNGNPGDIILVRAWYSQPLFTTFLAQSLSKLNDGRTLLTGTTVFRNEPFAAGTPPPPPPSGP